MLTIYLPFCEWCVLSLRPSCQRMYAVVYLLIVYLLMYVWYYNVLIAMNTASKLLASRCTIFRMITKQPLWLAVTEIRTTILIVLSNVDA